MDRRWNFASGRCGRRGRGAEVFGTVVVPLGLRVSAGFISFPATDVGEVVDTRAGGMNAIKILTLVGKVAGVIAGLNVIPFVPPQYGLFIFAGASILKDVVNRVGDLVDDGKQNDSFKA